MSAPELPTPHPLPERVPLERPEPRFWRNLLARLRWRDRRIHPLLLEHAALATRAIGALVQLLGDLEDQRGMVREIEAIEKRADQLVDGVLAALRRSVFPPHPRVAVVSLIHSLDDILDLAEDAAQTLHLYHITALTPEAHRLGQLAFEGTRHVEHAVALLGDPRQAAAVLAECERIDEIEAQADHVLRSGMSRLFRDEPDARELIKLRAIYEVLEQITDVCKDVAAALEAIILGHIGG